MAIEDQSGAAEQKPNFVAKASDVFARELFQPMFERANQAPEDVLQLIFEIRHKLDALDTVVATILGPNKGTRSNGMTPHPSLQAALESPVDPDTNSLNGFSMQHKQAAANGETFDDIGRNQRSRLRELTLLDFLSRDSRAYSLQQVLSALQAKGFNDSSGAVVSQLHRLKKVGVIKQPADGMYEITTSGLSHLHNLRGSFGSLLEDGRD